MQDAHSFADPQRARVTHLKLDLQVDFSKRILTGTASFDLQLAAGCTQVVFDTRKLQLQRITDVSGNSLDYVLAQEDPVLGAKHRPQPIRNGGGAEGRKAPQGPFQKAAAIGRGHDALH